MSIAFATKTWGGDYQKFLSGAFERKIEATSYPFDGAILVKNNGVPEDVNFSFPKFTQDAIPILGNIYCMGERSAVIFSETFEYLCYVQGDCLTMGILGSKPGGSGDWITPGITILEAESDVMVVSPASDVNTWHDKDGYDHYMSDQAWLVRVKDFLNPEVYQVEGIDPDYPSYGGNSFEHMVGKYLKKTGKKRKILNDFYILHPAY